MKELASFTESHEHLSMRRQCELLEINRSNSYYKPIRESDKNLHLMRLMDEHHLKHPTYGVLQMQDYLFAAGYKANHKRVRRLLRLMGIMAIYPKRNLSKLGKAKYIHPYLLREMDVTKPNQVWEIDITYIPMAKGFMYLTAIIDVYSRFVVGWNISNNLEAENCLQVLINAIGEYGKPGIVNSDQGSQFTSALWTGYLDNEEIKISMDGKGRAIDNIFIERLWRTVKQDYIYLSPIETGLELYGGLEMFFDHYNKHKAHQGIGRVTPITLYRPAA
jgi:putative transposase